MRIDEIEIGDIIRINENKQPAQIVKIQGNIVTVRTDNGAEQTMHLNKIYPFWDKKSSSRK